MSTKLTFLNREPQPASGYSVKLENFEGPLDLLLFLISKEKINIYDIPIAKITEQYLEYIQMMELLDLEVAGEFILMAATLIHIKTKMLLPAPLEQEEDPRGQLVEALLEYHKIQKVAENLEAKQKEESRFYPRVDFSFLQLPEQVVELSPPSLVELIRTFKNLLDRQPAEVIHAVAMPQVTVEERIKRVLSYLDDRGRAEFEELWADIPLKIYVVVTFLAVLELIRRGQIGFQQKSEFGPVFLWKTGN